MLLFFAIRYNLGTEWFDVENSSLIVDMITITNMVFALMNQQTVGVGEVGEVGEVGKVSNKEIQGNRITSFALCV